MTFHSGFVVSIEGSATNAMNYMDKTNQTDAAIEILMTLKNVNITFEVDSELEDFKGKTYSVIISIEGIEFDVKISRNHATGLVTPSIKYANLFGSQKNFKVINFPSNAYTQLIAKEVNAWNYGSSLISKLFFS